jgi:hypothetical protein
MLLGPIVVVGCQTHEFHTVLCIGHLISLRWLKWCNFFFIFLGIKLVTTAHRIKYAVMTYLRYVMAYSPYVVECLPQKNGRTPL